jgi:invasion protein IalB
MVVVEWFFFCFSNWLRENKMHLAFRRSKHQIVWMAGSIGLGMMAFLLVTLLLSSIVEAGPRVGDRFGDWVFSCKAYGPGETKCALTQEMRLKKGGKRILWVSLGYVGKANVLALMIRAPLNSFLPSGVQVKVDSGRQNKMLFQQCKKEGCITIKKISKNFRDELSRGNKLTAQFKLILKKGTIKIPVSISLRGTERGLLALEGKTSSGPGRGSNKKPQSPIF